MINKKTIIRYILLQIPELILLIIAMIICGKFINIPTWVPITVISIWIVKDILLFPKVWKAYQTNHQTPVEKLIGMNGIAMDNLNPNGYVKVNGELWKAKISDTKLPVEKGDKIKVIDARGMQLIVSLIRHQDSGVPGS